MYLLYMSILITVNAVSSYVATVEIPSGSRCADASRRKYNGHKESRYAAGGKLRYDLSQGVDGDEPWEK